MGVLLETLPAAARRSPPVRNRRRELDSRGRAPRPVPPALAPPAPAATSPPASPASGSPVSEQRTRLEPYLPLALLTSLVVTALPVALVALLVPSKQPASMLAAAAGASALSLALASAGAALWKRWRGSRDLVFSELLLWGWCRRYRSERRLGRARALYESARKAGPGVSIEQLAHLSKLLEVRDSSTQGHSQRVARHAGRIAETMHLGSAESAKVRTAAAVHDVGKLYTPRAILNKPGALTDEEYEVLKRHPVDGAEMLAHVGDSEIAAMVRHHHERLDGSGYPDHLAGEQIPLGSRIIAVADTFDAISSNRVYRTGRTHKKALDILAEEANTRLDGAVVAAFMQSYSARRRLAGLTFVSAFAERLLVWVQSSSATLGLGAAGVAPLLPALGAVGVLSLSHGHTVPIARVPAPAGARAAAQGARGRAPTGDSPAGVRVGPRANARGPGRAHGVYRPAAPDARTVAGSPAPSAIVTPSTTGVSAASLTTNGTSAGGDQGGSIETNLPPSPVGVTRPGQPVGVAPVSVPPVSSPVPVPALPTSTPLVSVPSKEATLSTPVVKVTDTTPAVEVPKLTLP